MLVRSRGSILVRVFVKDGLVEESLAETGLGVFWGKSCTRRCGSATTGSRASLGTSGRITVLRSLQILGRLLAVRLCLVIRLSLHHVGQVNWPIRTKFELQLKR